MDSSATYYQNGLLNASYFQACRSVLRAIIKQLSITLHGPNQLAFWKDGKGYLYFWSVLEQCSLLSDVNAFQVQRKEYDLYSSGVAKASRHLGLKRQELVSGSPLLIGM